MLLSFMAFSTMLSLLLISMHSLRLIGQEIPLIEGQQLVIIIFLGSSLISWQSNKTNRYGPLQH